jgi:dsRNA-specific ribonuclease/ERCC4-related helicase
VKALLTSVPVPLAKFVRCPALVLAKMESTVAVQGTHRAIPRPYQQELFEKAKESNIIVFLDTGGGKTLIAAMLIEHVVTRIDHGPRLSIFIVNNRALGEQQFRALQKYFDGTAVRVANYNGYGTSLVTTVHITQWDESHWRKQYQTMDVMVMTADLFLNSLRHAFVTMSDIGLLVFDECHHARLNAPMSLIMKEFYHSSSPYLIDCADDAGVHSTASSDVASKRLRPKILGLTASPVNSGGRALEDPEVFKKQTRDLEQTLDAVIVSPDRGEVKKYISQPVETARLFRVVPKAERAREDAVMDKLQLIVDSLSSRTLADHLDDSEIRRRCRIVLECLEMLGAWCSVQLVVNWIKSFVLLRIQKIALQVELAARNVDLMEVMIKPNGEQAIVWTVRRINHMLSCLYQIVIVLQKEYFPDSAVAECLQDEILSPDHAAVDRTDADDSTIDRSNTVISINANSDSDLRQENYGASSVTNDVSLLDIIDTQFSLVNYGLPAHPTDRSQMSYQLCDLLALIKELQHQDWTEENKLCMIVFVERRTVAVLVSLVINAIFSSSQPTVLDGRLGGTRLLSLPLTGAEIKETALDRSDMFGGSRALTNADVLEQFRTGAVQIIVATAVAEEGLDIAACKVVIRFNPLKNLVSYLQSRGRARHMDSKYILMIERGSKETIANMQKYEQQMREHVTVDNARTQEEQQFRDACERELDDLLADKEANVAYYTVASTGAKVTLHSSIALLHSYCQTLPSDSYSVGARDPVITITRVGLLMFQCDLKLPSSCPVRNTIQSALHPSKRLAKQHACLEACRQLHQFGAMNDHLIPTEWITRKEQILAREMQLRYKIDVIGHQADQANDDAATIAAAKTAAETSLTNTRTYTHKSISWCPEKHLLDGLDEIRQCGVSFYAYHVCSSGVVDGTQNREAGYLMPLLLLSLVPLPDCVPVSCSGTVNFAAAEDSLRDHLHSMELRFSGKCLRFSFDQLGRIQRYFCFLLSAILPSTYTTKLLARPTVYSPIMIAPGLVLGDCPINENTDIIDWHEVNRVVDHMTLGIATNIVSTRLQHEVDKSDSSLHNMLQETLLLSFHQRNNDGGWSFRRMLFADVIPNMDPFNVFVKRIYQEDKIDPRTLTPAIQQLITLGDVLSHRHRTIEDVRGSTCIVTKPAPSMRAVNAVSKGKRSKASREGDDEQEIVVCSKSEGHYCIQTSMRAANLADFVVPVNNVFVHPIPSGRLHVLLPIPVAIFIAEHFLTVQECRDTLLPRMKNLELLWCAVTCTSAQMPVNYERLETLGDSLLKLLITMHVMHAHPFYHEGQLTSKRSQDICNQHLFNVATDVGLTRFIISDSFVGRKFLPLGVDDICPNLPGGRPLREHNVNECTTMPMNEISCKEPTTRLLDRQLADKTVSDVVEAMIGSYYLDCDESLEHVWNDVICGPLKIIRPPEGARCDNEGSVVQSEPCLCPFPLLTEFGRREVSAYSRPLIEKMSSILQYRFQNPALLLDALTHQTFQPDIVFSTGSDSSRLSGTSYQRLEFLGDAVIDFIVMRYLYDWVPALNPGELSDWKSQCVCNESLARCSVNLGLHKYARYSSDPLRIDIDKYIRYCDFVVDSNSEECRFNLLHTDDKRQCSAPKLLGDIFESVVGAMFVDSKCDIHGVVKDFVYAHLINKILEPLLEKARVSSWGTFRHRASVVDEIRAVVRCRDHWTAFLDPVESNEVTCKYVVHGKVLASARGPSRESAELAAAKILLNESDASGQDQGPQQYLRRLNSLCTCLNPAPTPQSLANDEPVLHSSDAFAEDSGDDSESDEESDALLDWWNSKC